MGDSDIKSETGRGEDAPPIELASRIMRRRTEPLGIIDAQHPQQLYARTAGWIARRFALLDHWKTRYGSDEESGAAQANLVFTSSGRSSADPTALLSNQVQLPRKAPQVKAPESTMASPVAQPPPERFRIRRHSGPKISPSQTTTPFQAEQKSLPSADSPVVKTNAPINAANAPGSVGSNEPMVSRSVDATRVASPEKAPRSTEITETAQRFNESHDYPLRRSPQLGGESDPQDPYPGGTEKNPVPKTGDYPLARHGATPPPKMSEERTPAGDREMTQPSGSSPPAAVGGPVRVMPLSGSINAGESSSGPTPLVRRRFNEADTGLAKAPRERELTVPETPLPSKQISSANQSTGVQQELLLPTAVEGVTKRITTPVKTPARHGGIEPGTGASPVAVNSPPSLPLVQRQSTGETGAATPRAGKDANRQPMAPDETGQQAATSEIRVGSSAAPKPPLVWRTGAAGPGGGDDRSESPLSISTTGKTKKARQTDAIESMPVTNAESATRTAPAPSAPPANHPDVAQLAEQVGRILARQLAVECERRGRRGWS
jgi:hypothetical protein